MEYLRLDIPPIIVQFLVQFGFEMQIIRKVSLKWFNFLWGPICLTTWQKKLIVIPRKILIGLKTVRNLGNGKMCEVELKEILGLFLLMSKVRKYGRDEY